MKSELHKIHRSIFYINNRPYCFYDVDIFALNIEYLEKIDPNYFDYIAKVHLNNKIDDDRYKRATAIRLHYFHALETMFALMCALIQAPKCIYGWMLKYTNQDLREMVKAIDANNVKFHWEHSIEKINWIMLAKTIYKYLSMEEGDKETFINTISLFWHRMAQAIIEENNVAEYNSLKHGFRIGVGPVALYMGPEKGGVSPPPGEMMSIGEAEYSHTYFIPYSIGNIKNNHNIAISRQTVAWNPEVLCKEIILIGYTIQNIVSYLKFTNGIDPSTISYRIPIDINGYNTLMDESPSLHSFSMKNVYEINENELLTIEKMREILNIKS